MQNMITFLRFVTSTSQFYSNGFQKDMEPGNDVNNMIEANRDAAVRVDQNMPVDVSPQLSPEPSVTSQIEKEIEDIPKIADEIRQSMEDLNSKVTGAPQITKTDVQAFLVQTRLALSIG